MKTKSSTLWLDANIEWIVAISVMLITTFSVVGMCINSFFPIFTPIISILHPSIISLVCIYQYKHYGFRVLNNKFMVFFLIYSVYIFLYITSWNVYRLENLHGAPTSLAQFFNSTIRLIAYLFCAETIARKLNARKFLLLSVLFCTIPSLLYINYVGVNFIQDYSNAYDENYLGTLVLGYTNVPIMVLALVNHNKLIGSRKLSLILTAVIVVSISYILIVGTKRGPILWCLVNILICVYYMKRKVFKYLVIAIILIIVIYIYFDVIIDTISSFAPETAERFKRAIYEQDTSHRLDMQDQKGSGFIIAFNQFLSSPLWGSYFRLITNSWLFKGHYPHNVFFFFFITMGLIGFIPFLFFVFTSIKNISKVFRMKYSTQSLTCLVLFLSVFLQLQTTSTIVLNIKFWLFFYIMCILDRLSLTPQNKLKWSIQKHTLL